MVRFLKNSDSVWNVFGWIQFENAVRFGYCDYYLLLIYLLILIIYLLSRVVNLQQILQHYCYVE